MENILVSIRVRPLSKQEALKGTPWKLTSNTITLSSGPSASGQTFTFDRVFGTDSKTADIYEALTKRIISSAVHGFNGTIFAYGQTSSGKTYTMRGSQDEPGVIPMAILDVFRNIEAETNREFLLRVSYMEIYNEEIKDLLAPENRKLQVHESVERGIFVAGLREEIVVSPQQVLQLMETGEAHRHIGETNMNVHSSRSHAIFRMVIESRDRSDDPSERAFLQTSDPVRVSHLNLVDLAGSERVNKTGAEGTRLKEGTHINKSLMTLGNVINKLSEGIERQGGHVPYRDSKLTRILQPALGGNAKTLIICNITPALVHVDETRGTLQFASRANRVTNCAQVNEIMTDAALLKRQKKEIEELQRRLQESPSDHWEGEILNLRNELLKTELEKERMAMELQESQKAQAERERRIKEQQQKIENLSTMVINSAVDDRGFDKRNKKGSRRETWCARPHSKPVLEELPEIKKAAQKDHSAAPSVDFSLPVNKKRSFGLPPPFEKLMEDDEGLSISLSKGTSFSFDETAEEGFNMSDDFSVPEHTGQSFVVERRRRSSGEWITGNEVEQELSELQAQYDNLQCEHVIKMKEKEFEIEQLRRELVQAQLSNSKTGGKKDSKQRRSLETDKRGRSLEGWKESEFAVTINQLRTQVRQLETEKLYMQRELDNVLEQAREQSTAVKQELQEVYQELNEAKEESVELNCQLDLYLKQIQQLQMEKRDDQDAYVQLAAAFHDLKSEVDSVLAFPNVLQSSINDSLQAITFSLTACQECIADVKDVSSMASMAVCERFSSVDSDRESETQLLNHTRLEEHHSVDIQSSDMSDNMSNMALAIPAEEVPQTSTQLIASCDDCEPRHFSVLPEAEDRPCLNDLEVDGLREEDKTLLTVVESLRSELGMEKKHLSAMQNPSDDEEHESSMRSKNHESRFLTTIQESETEDQTRTKDCFLTATEVNFAGSEQDITLDSNPLGVEVETSSQMLTTSSMTPSEEGLKKQAVTEIELSGVASHVEFAADSTEPSSADVVPKGTTSADAAIDIDPSKVMNLKEAVASLQRQVELAEVEKQRFVMGEAALKEKLEKVMESLQTLKHEQESLTKANGEAMELLHRRETQAARITKKLTASCGFPGQTEKDFVVAGDTSDSSISDDKLRILEIEVEQIIEERRCLREVIDSAQIQLEAARLENERLQDREGFLEAEADQVKRLLQMEKEEPFSSKEASKDEEHALEEERILQREVILLEEIRDLKAYLHFLESEVEMLKTASLETETRNKCFLDREGSLLDEINELKTSLNMMQEEIITLTRTSTVEREEKEEVLEREAVLIAEVSHLKESLQLLEEEKRLEDSTLEAIFSKLESIQSSSDSISVENEKFTRLVTLVDSLLQEKIGLKDSLEILQKDMRHASTETERLLRKEADLLEEVMDLKSKLKLLEEDSKTMMIRHQQQEADLVKQISDLQEEKDMLVKSVHDGDGQMQEFRVAAAEALKELESWQHRYQSESSQFRSEIMALRKELSAAKAAPAGLAKERDSLSRALEKLKARTKDTEAKLKSALQDKSKLETEKLNMERELKQLRQSTSMQRDISRRDSVVDQRRQSIALGLNKTKNQLSSLENALQIKTEEVERLTYELHLSKESYSKLEFAMAEAESYSKEQVAEVEKQMSQLYDEKAAVTLSTENLKNELEAARELCGKKVHELETLQEELRDLRDQLRVSENNIKIAELSAAELTREKEEIVQELIDAHIRFQKEKADLNTQAQENRDKYNALNMEIMPLTEELQKVKKLQEESMESNRILQDKLQEALETISEKSLLHHKQIQQLEGDVDLYKDRCRGLEKDLEIAVKREQEFRVSGCSQLEKLREELQFCKIRLSAAQDAEQSLSLENGTMFTSNMKLQVALDATRDRLEVFEGRLEQSDWELAEFKSLLQKVGFMRGDAWNLVSLQQFEKHIKNQNEEARKLEAELAGKKLEMVELEVEYENMRGQCEKYQEEIQYLQKKVLTPEEEIEHRNKVAEMAEQNRKLQVHLRKAEDKAKEFADVVKAKEASLTALQTTLEGLHATNIRLEKELNASKAELQSAQQLNKLAVRAGAIGKTTTPIFKSAARQDKLQAQSTSQSATSFPSSLGLSDRCGSPLSMDDAKETTSALRQGSPVLRRVPLAENAAVATFHSSEGKGARSFLTSSKLPQSVRPSTRGFILPDSRYNLRRNKENLEHM